MPVLDQPQLLQPTGTSRVGGSGGLGGHRDRLCSPCGQQGPAPMWAGGGGQLWGAGGPPSSPPLRVQGSSALSLTGEGQGGAGVPWGPGSPPAVGGPGWQRGPLAAPWWALGDAWRGQAEWGRLHFHWGFGGCLGRQWGVVLDSWEAAGMQRGCNKVQQGCSRAQGHSRECSGDAVQCSGGAAGMPWGCGAVPSGCSGDAVGMQCSTVGHSGDAVEMQCSAIWVQRGCSAAQQGCRGAQQPQLTSCRQGMLRGCSEVQWSAAGVQSECQGVRGPQLPSCRSCVRRVLEECSGTQQGGTAEPGRGASQGMQWDAARHSGTQWGWGRSSDAAGTQGEGCSGAQSGCSRSRGAGGVRWGLTSHRRCAGKAAPWGCGSGQGRCCTPGTVCQSAAPPGWRWPPAWPWRRPRGPVALSLGAGRVSGAGAAPLLPATPRIGPHGRPTLGTPEPPSPTGVTCDPRPQLLWDARELGWGVPLPPPAPRSRSLGAQSQPHSPRDPQLCPAPQRRGAHNPHPISGGPRAKPLPAPPSRPPSPPR